MLTNLIGNDPNKKQAWLLAQQIVNNGGSKQQMIESACKQSGLNPKEVEQNLQTMGIDLYK